MRKLPDQRFVRAAAELPATTRRKRNDRECSTAPRELDTQPTSKGVPNDVRAMYAKAIELRFDHVERCRDAVTIRGGQWIAAMVSRHSQRYQTVMILEVRLDRRPYLRAKRERMEKHERSLPFVSVSVHERT